MSNDSSRKILQVIVASTRPGRIGRSIGDWIAAATAEVGPFDVELVDLKEVNLPFFDEPNHPMLGQYTHQHTKDWASTIARADAFIFVMPEYNHGFIAPLKNALDFLHAEWQFKPVGFATYGGVSAGTRAAQMLKPVVQALRMTPVVEAITIPFPAPHFDEEGAFVPNELIEQSAAALVAELAVQADVLSVRRAQ
jgi:NAD(P)H-dependent FMN reductase